MFNFQLIRGIRLAALVVASSLLAATPLTTLAKDKLPEVSSDGLLLMPHSKLYAVYVKPGATLDTYTKVKILDCFVEFAKDWEQDYNLNEIGLEGRVTAKDADEIKQRLATEFKAVFTKRLEKKGYPVVDEVGPEVLLLRPAIINLEVTAPDLMEPNMMQTVVASAGQMTLYMEMYDSATSDLLVRVIDPEADREMGAEVANEVTNKAAADRIISRWADLLIKHLGSVKEKTSSR